MKPHHVDCAGGATCRPTWKLALAIAAAVTCTVVISTYANPEWHLGCVAWQDTSDCNVYCNCPDQPCCITWTTGAGCKSCVWMIGAGDNECTMNGTTYILDDYMISDCIDDWTTGSSGEPTASGECACAGGTEWRLGVKPCDPSCQ